MDLGSGLRKESHEYGRGESYSLPYVEPLRVARTPLADFVNSLLVKLLDGTVNVTWAE
jgi:hypothetical protein